MSIEFIYAILLSLVISGIIAICLGVLGFLMHRKSQSKIIRTTKDELGKSKNEKFDYKKIKKHNVIFIFIGIMMIISGINIDSLTPWIDQTTLTIMESCVADMHFRHDNETQFRECVSPDLKKIEAVQHLIILTAAMYSIGGIFIGYGFTKKS